MKVGIFNPYLDTLGGGERYTLSLAEFCLKNGWDVNLFWRDRTIVRKANERFGLNIKKLKVDSTLFELFSRKGKIIEKFIETKRYDLILFVSDGSVPWFAAKRSLVFFQVPFHEVGGRNLRNQLKLKTIDKVVCYSKFVKRVIDKEFGINALVLPPFVADDFKPGKKDNVILSVGRFDNLLHNKRQDVLIETFIELYQKEIKNWQLYLVGGVIHGKGWVKSLKKKAKGFPIKIITNVSFKELLKLYAKAEIYWHAAGFGVDEKQHPEYMEHFGLTTVEAMKSGAVPIVFEGGGQKEIVTVGKNGLFWGTKEQLIEKTLKVMKNNKLRQKLSIGAQKRADDFSKKQFCQMTKKIFGL